ncbi:MAG TPA: hypothetical protein VF721_10365 [Pyrinomonadaceae bacterium]|jgi:hypothetical protein
MATTVEIEIIGVAITYQKGTNWHILFPLDDAGCHKVNFKSKKDGEAASGITPLRTSETIEIEITPKNGATSTTGANDEFNNQVYNLTSTTRPRTHSKIRKKDDADGKYVRMILPNANFSVRYAITNFKVPQLTEEVEIGLPQPPQTIPLPLAHSVRATITLKTDAQVKFSAKKDGRPFDFITDKNSSYTLTFNNDCEDPKNRENDMKLYYRVIEEFKVRADGTEERVGRKFLIGDTNPSTAKLDKEEFFEITKDPPDSRSFAEGNTCLVSQVTEKDSIAKLP